MVTLSNEPQGQPLTKVTAVSRRGGGGGRGGGRSSRSRGRSNSNNQGNHHYYPYYYQHHHHDNNTSGDSLNFKLGFGHLAFRLVPVLILVSII